MRNIKTTRHEQMSVFDSVRCLQHTSTATEGGLTIHDTTYEVDYAAIILQKAMKWFMLGVADLDNQDVHFPDQSHGFSTVLANVHRAHPRISTACGFHPPQAKRVSS